MISLPVIVGFVFIPCVVKLVSTVSITSFRLLPTTMWSKLNYKQTGRLQYREQKNLIARLELVDFAVQVMVRFIFPLRN